MSEQARLLTSSEIGRVNELLNALSENLFFHRNGSLAKGHGLQLLTSPYYDSYGDKLSDYVLRMAVESTPGNLEIVYAPADLVSNYNTKVPPGGVTLPATLPTSLGVVSASSGPDGTVNSPGIPQLASNLLTRYTETLSQDLEIADALLKAHALLSHGEHNPAPHRGISIVSEELTDSLGHVLGSKVAKITIGNQQYKVPCDENITGPPQAPRITSHPVDKTAKDDTEPLPTVTYSVTVGGGDSPFTYQWQIATINVSSKTDPLLDNPAAWQDMTDGNTYNSPRYSGTQCSPILGAQAATMSIHQTGTSKDNQWLDPAFIYRCKVTSATGGVAYSLAAKMKTYDETGC